MQSTTNDWGKQVSRQDRTVKVQITKLLLIIFLLTLMMWGVNVLVSPALNIVPFFFGTIWLLSTGLSPIAIGAAALTGSLFRASQLQSVPQGFGEGAKFWVTRAVPAIVLSFHALTALLATWSFAENPGAFWSVAAGLMTIGSATIAYQKFESGFSYKIIVGYSAAVVLIALASTFSWWGSVEAWWDEEAAAVVQAEKRAEELEQAVHEARIAAARIAAAALAEEQAVAERAQATGQPCAGRWTGLDGCVSVTFGPNEKYDRTATIGTCLSMDPPDAVTRTSLGGNDWRHVPTHPGVTVRFFDHPIGETILGATCG
jgi:hypothetical protein